MPDYTQGSEAAIAVPVISANTAAVLKHRAKFYYGTTAIDIPLVKGTRYIIHSLISSGATVSIGFGQNAGTITDNKLTYTQTAGPIDLTNFFGSAPFTEYKEKSASFNFLTITTTGGQNIAVAVSEFKG